MKRHGLLRYYIIFVASVLMLVFFSIFQKLAELSAFSPILTVSFKDEFQVLGGEAALVMGMIMFIPVFFLNSLFWYIPSRRGYIDILLRSSIISFISLLFFSFFITDLSWTESYVIAPFPFLFLEILLSSFLVLSFLPRRFSSRDLRTIRR